MAPGWASYFSSTTSSKGNFNTSSSSSSSSSGLQDLLGLQATTLNISAYGTRRRGHRAWMSRSADEVTMSHSESDSESSISDDCQASKRGRKTLYYPEPDMMLLGELMEQIEKNPSAPEARKLLMEQYVTCGWFEAARDVAHEVLTLSPSDKEARACLDVGIAIPSTGSGKGKGKGTGTGKGKGKGKAKNEGHTKAYKQENNKKGKTGGLPTDSATAWRPSLLPISSPASALRELEDGYAALLRDAKVLHRETKLLHGLKGMEALGRERHLFEIAALAQGKVSSVITVKPLGSVKDVASAVDAQHKGGSNGGLEVAFRDLQEMMKWLTKSDDGKITPNDDYDALRDALVQRVRALKGLLPTKREGLADQALMHAEHELLERTYANTETMLGDEVSDIPRDNFWVSEDGYAWDMDELAQAITSNGGVMRNPLSSVPFTPADVRNIVQHPLGKRLGALQVEQSKLKQGVRAETIRKLGELSNVLLEDMTEDQAPSRHAVDAFAAYLATLPSGEQTAIDGLKVPATDSHTGIEYDGAIGEAIRDAQANRVCIHKTGDFLSQVVKHLGK